MQNPTLLTIPQDVFTGESEKAYGFNCEGKQFWLPKSQCRDFQMEGDNYSVWLPEWLVEKNGLEQFIDTSYMPSLF